MIGLFSRTNVTILKRRLMRADPSISHGPRGTVLSSSYMARRILLALLQSFLLSDLRTRCDLQTGGGMEMSEWLMISRALPASWQTCAEGVLMFGAYCGGRTDRKSTRLNSSHLG